MRSPEGSGVPASQEELADIPVWGAYVGAVVSALLMFVPLLPKLASLYIGSPRTDMKMTYRNWITHAVRSVWEGEIPLWNPYIYCGQPFMPSTHGTLFYPPNWLFLLGLPQPLSINFCILMQVAILAAGVVFFARSRGSSNIAALMAGAVAAMGSVTVCRMFAGHFTMLCTSVWIPWMFALQGRLFRGERRALLPFALTGAVMFMGGHLQIAYYYGLFLGVSLFVHAGLEVKRGERLRWMGRQWLWHAGAGAVALGLVAVEALPALDIAAHSMRSADRNIQFLREFAMPPGNLITMIAPRFFGSGTEYWGRWEWWEATFYFGVIGLGLCGAAVGARLAAERRLGALEVMFFLCIGIAVAGYLPVLPKLLQFVPGWMMFRGHNRPLLFALVFGSVLAAGGLDAVRADLRGRASLVARGLFLLVAVIAGGLAAAAGPDFWRGAIGAVVRDKELFNPNPAASAEALTQAVATARTSLLTGLGVAVLGFALIQWGRRLPGQAWPWTVVGVAVTEMVLFAMPPPMFPPTRNIVPPLAVSFMAEKGGEARSGVPGRGMMNEGTMHRIPSIEGNDIVVTRYYNSFLCAYLGAPKVFPAMSFFMQGDSPLLDPANVEYIGLDPQSPAVRQGALPLVKMAEDLAIVRRPTALPRAYVVGTARWVAEDDAAVHGALMEGIDFHSEVLLAGTDDGEVGERFPAVAAKAEYRGLHEVRVTAPKSGWLVLADGYYPLWRAYVGEKEVPVLRANGTFRAVKAREGEEVVFRYENSWFSTGAGISLVSLCGVAGWGAWWGVGKRRRRGGVRG